MDYCTANGTTFLVLVYAHSKWMDVFPTRSADTETIVKKLRMSFAYPIPGATPFLVSDNA